MNEAFNIFLEEKRIDAQALKKARLDVYETWEKEFREVGEQVFDQHKKFLFNPFRLDFPYNTHTPREKNKPIPGKKKGIPKPVMKPKGSEINTSPGSKKKLPLRKPVMKKRDDTESEGSPTPTKKKPLMKRPIMKKPIMKPAKRKKNDETPD